jgi:type II secretion system protein I
MRRRATRQALSAALGAGGFTLLEVLIALAVASLTLVTALAAVGTAQRNATLAQLKSQACMLARAKMAELDAGDYPDPDPSGAINPGAAADQLIWIEEGEFEETDTLFNSEPATWRSDFYWQTILESAPGMEGIRMLTVRVFAKRFRARPEEARWRDYIKEDYQLLVEIVTYRAAHYWAEADAK